MWANLASSAAVRVLAILGVGVSVTGGATAFLLDALRKLQNDEEAWTNGARAAPRSYPQRVEDLKNFFAEARRPVAVRAS